ncbi:hypothetical protein K439DRAFT_1642071 [Ramaria rubella]|nr:hypothetical protein K439DRAFT_1642071 [Ramaria rubella]
MWAPGLTGFQMDAVQVRYFDEAHVLAADTKPLTTNPDDKYLYDILCSCFNFFLGRSIFFIFLSTSTSIDVFAPSFSMARSARMRDNIDALQAPITEVPFDCAPESLVQPYCHKLDHVCSVAFMSKFGRPLYDFYISHRGYILMANRFN